MKPNQHPIYEASGEAVIEQPGWPQGMNNLLPAEMLPITMLRNAINVDIGDSGEIMRRKGATKLFDGVDMHSLYGTGSRSYAVNDNDFTMFDSAFNPTVLRTDVGANPMQYEDLNGELYYTNGTICGKVVGGVDKEWGVEAPTSAPALSATDGYLTPGRYQAVCTFLNALGEESGCGASNVIALTTLGGIEMVLPVPISADISYKRVYLSPTDGDVMYEIVTVPAAQTGLTVTTMPAFTRALRTQFKRRVFPGALLTYYNGRIYLAQGNILWYTEPYAYGLIDVTKNFFVFDTPITMIAGVADAAGAKGGVFVACAATYYLRGDGPDTFQQESIFPFGAAKYSLSRHPTEQQVIWYSDRGIVVGENGGKTTLIQSENVIPGAYTTGATLVKELDGIKQVVAAVEGGEASKLTAFDYMDAELIRAGS